VKAELSLDPALVSAVERFIAAIDLVKALSDVPDHDHFSSVCTVLIGQGLRACMRSDGAGSISPKDREAILDLLDQSEAPPWWESYEGTARGSPRKPAEREDD
jgi:hypothetical protein